MKIYKKIFFCRLFTLLTHTYWFTWLILPWITIFEDNIWRQYLKFYSFFFFFVDYLHCLHCLHVHIGLTWLVLPWISIFDYIWRLYMKIYKKVFCELFTLFSLFTRTYWFDLTCFTLNYCIWLYLKTIYEDLQKGFFGDYLHCLHC